MISLLAVILLASCGQDFKKGIEGLDYKIISDGKGEKLKNGMFMQLHVAQIYTDGKKDTVLSNSRDAYPVIELFDSVSTPKEFYQILIQARKGDSLVIRTPTDTIFKRVPGGIPPYMKKGNYLLTTVKMLNLFTSEAQADSARKKEMELARLAEEKRAEAQMKKEEAKLQEYFKKNNITVVKAPKGTYVQIIEPGTGMAIDTTVVVKTNYTGRLLLEGKVFDSNTDSSFNHVEPFPVNMTNDFSLGGGVIKGWTDGLTMLKEGGKAKFFIPSPLAYGERGAGGDIPANSILAFDIEVTDVMTKEEAKADMEAKRKKMMAEQKRISDSLEVVRKKADTSAKGK